MSSYCESKEVDKIEIVGPYNIIQIRYKICLYDTETNNILSNPRFERKSYNPDDINLVKEDGYLNNIFNLDYLWSSDVIKEWGDKKIADQSE